MDEVYVVRRDDPMDHEGYPQLVAVFADKDAAETAAEQWQKRYDEAQREQWKGYYNFQNFYYVETVKVLREVPPSDPTFPL